MGIITAINRNKGVDNDSKTRPVYVDDRGRMMANHGLDGDVYSLFLPPVAVGANKVFFDLFNADSADIEVLSVTPIVSGAVAVTGTLAVDLYLTRTTAVGTGGTAATAEGTDLTAATFTKFDPRSPTKPTGITARAAPAGGATAGAVLALDSLFTEETNAASYNRANMIKDNQMGTRLVVPKDSGIRVVQGTVASVGNIGFQVVFSTVKKA